MVERPPLRYFGAKFRLAPQIVAHFPPHTCYVEPFGGAAGVLLRKEPSPVEVYNDLEEHVVNFFRVLRERPDDLVRAIALTPYARAELRYAHDGSDTGDPLERARRFYVISWQQFGGTKIGTRNGWRTIAHARGGTRNPMHQWRAIEHLYDVAARLRAVFIECDDALEVIAHYDRPDTLFYADPPYLSSTRSTRWKWHSYAREFDEDDHRRLADALQGIAGMAVVSGYPSPLYDALYAGWERVELSARDHQGQPRVEVLWLSPALVARLAAPVQPPLLKDWCA